MVTRYGQADVLREVSGRKVISQKCVTNRIESDKESIDRQSVIAVQSRCQGVVGCLAHVRVYSVKQ